MLTLDLYYKGCKSAALPKAFTDRTFYNFWFLSFLADAPININLTSGLAFLPKRKHERKAKEALLHLDNNRDCRKTESPGGYLLVGCHQKKLHS